VLRNEGKRNETGFAGGAARKSGGEADRSEERGGRRLGESMSGSGPRDDGGRKREGDPPQRPSSCWRVVNVRMAKLQIAAEKSTSFCLLLCPLHLVTRPNRTAIEKHEIYVPLSISLYGHQAIIFIGGWDQAASKSRKQVSRDVTGIRTTRLSLLCQSACHSDT